eukprot:scaffold1727_cov61-Phaeocystis_antarctica.AAC.3
MAEFAMDAALIAAQSDTIAKIEANKASKPKWQAELAAVFEDEMRKSFRVQDLGFLIVYVCLFAL